jgi:YD repeat-containing protein
LWAAVFGASALAATTTYEYDALGRLVKASQSSTNEATYAYDAAGNRTQKVLAGSSSGSSGELIPSGFTKYGVHTYYYYDNDPADLRDGQNNNDNTSIAVYIGWVKMDLGATFAVDEIRVLPIIYAYQGWGAALLNGAIVEYSTDDSNWTSVGTISGATETAYKSIPIGASARYIRISSTSASSNQLGIGDFRAFGS